jgi:HK97 gp10 family phage protein
MADSAIRLTGLRELGEKLKDLSSAVQLRISRAAVNAGAQVIKAQAIANAPESEKAHMLDGVLVEPGNLKANIVVKKIQSPLTAEYIVTVRGKRKDGYAARYGRLVEFGTINFLPKPFLRTAYDSKKQQAAVTIKVELENRIIKNVGK